MPKKTTRHRPLSSIPTIAATRLRPCTKPIKLTSKASGGTTNKHNPPRIVMGDPHPGCTAIKRSTIAGATSDSPKPHWDRLVVGGEGGGSVKFGESVGGRSVFIERFRGRIYRVSRRDSIAAFSFVRPSFPRAVN
jgi:hypothetical protein